MFILGTVNASRLQKCLLKMTVAENDNLTDNI